MQVLRTAERPVTRAELQERAKKILPGIGFATVSRAVNDLLGERALVSLRYPGQPTRYEQRSQKEHPHLLCYRCQCIVDLDVAMPEISLPEVPGAKVTGYEVLFFGECKECVGKR